MYSFINDLSISPNGVSLRDNWGIIKELIHVTNELRKYKLTRIRVHKDFIKTNISGSHSIEYYLGLGTEFDHDDRALLLSFIANNIDDRPEEVAQVVAAKEEGKLIDVYFNNSSSNQFMEAHLMDCPLVSFLTSPLFSIDFLDAQLFVYYGEGEPKAKPIKIENLFKTESVTTHQEFLIDWKKKIVFSKTRWKPLENPIWNDLTKKTIEELQFPKSIEQKADKHDELRRVGTIVAEMNAWVFDKNVTTNNKSGNHLRKIFRSESGRSTCYLSIDFESPYGGFEVHNHRGKHQGEIDFLGKKKEDADNKKKHDIKI